MWYVNGGITVNEAIECYYVDPGTQEETKLCRKWHISPCRCPGIRKDNKVILAAAKDPDDGSLRFVVCGFHAP